MFIENTPGVVNFRILKDKILQVLVSPVLQVPGNVLISPYKFTCQVTFCFLFHIFLKLCQRNMAEELLQFKLPLFPKILDFSGHTSYEYFHGKFCRKQMDGYL